MKHIRTFESFLNEATNKTKVRIIDVPSWAPPKILLQKFCLLRTAEKPGDVEIVNNTQLGRLRDCGVGFEILKENDIYENKKVISPEVRSRMNTAATMSKIEKLKKELLERPEQRNFIDAKIKVEQEKLDMIVAKQSLLMAKEREDERKKREKRYEEKEKKRILIKKSKV